MRIFLKNAKPFVPKYIKNLKSRNVYHYKCNKCDFSQGHPLQYCPKCPGKLQYIEETLYNDFLSRTNLFLQREFFWKHEFEYLFKGKCGYMSFKVWGKLILIIKKEIK